MNKLLLLILLISAFASCRKNEKIQLVGTTQGSYYAVTFFGNVNERQGIQHGVDSILKEIDASVSLWNDSSVISRVNRNDTSVTLDKHFVENFNWAMKAAEFSNGAFDPTIGPLVEAWGFHNKKEMEMTPEFVDSIRQLVDYRKIQIENGKIVKANPNMTLDFNAVAQGYTSDVIGKYLLSLGVENFLVDVGGEILARGTKPNGGKWVVGIERPSDDKYSERSVQTEIELYNQAIVTSGNYRKYIEKEGQRYSHTIDPKTGYPVQRDLLSATVVADNAAWADCLASICMIVGREDAKKLLSNFPEVKAYFIFSDENGELQVELVEN